MQCSQSGKRHLYFLTHTKLLPVKTIHDRIVSVPQTKTFTSFAFSPIRLLLYLVRNAHVRNDFVLPRRYLGRRCGGGIAAHAACHCFGIVDSVTATLVEPDHAHNPHAE